MADPSWNFNKSFPGPLTTSAIALFGNDSWYNLVNYLISNVPLEAYNDEDEVLKMNTRPICSLVHLSRLVNRYETSCEPHNSYGSILETWLTALQEKETMEKALAASMTLANQALLTASAEYGRGRPIYYSP